MHLAAAKRFREIATRYSRRPRGGSANACFSGNRRGVLAFQFPRCALRPLKPDCAEPHCNPSGRRSPREPSLARTAPGAMLACVSRVLQVPGLMALLIAD